jgi:hypothetical protein
MGTSARVAPKPSPEPFLSHVIPIHHGKAQKARPGSEIEGQKKGPSRQAARQKVPLKTIREALFLEVSKTLAQTARQSHAAARQGRR